MASHIGRVLWAVGLAASTVSMGAQDRTVTAKLVYGAPGAGPAVNFSPKGTQVPLADVATSMKLPDGAARPAKVGTLLIGPTAKSHLQMLITADSQHPTDLCRLYLDRNRNGRFDDDGPALVATPSQNEKTKAWWSSFAKTELRVPYASGEEPYLVSFWIVRENDAVPTIARFSVGSWRQGEVEVDGERALVAVMDSNNDAVFDSHDMWSVLAASETDAPKRVLSIAEARSMDRLMFMETPDKERSLQFKRVSADGRSIEFAVVDRGVTKKADRAPDDEVGPERGRPRAATPIAWGHGKAAYTAAVANAKASGKLVLLDFEATWCGPCKTMDEWIWSDKDVAGAVSSGFIGVKLDGDIETDLVHRYEVHGYPTGVVLDSNDAVVGRFEGYRTSAQILALLHPGTSPQ